MPFSSCSVWHRGEDLQKKKKRKESSRGNEKKKSQMLAGASASNFSRSVTQYRPRYRERFGNSPSCFSAVCVPCCQSCQTFLKTHQHSRFRFLKPAAWRRHEGGGEVEGGGVSSQGCRGETATPAGQHRYVHHTPTQKKPKTRDDLHFRSRESKWVLEHVFGYLNWILSAVLECLYLTSPYNMMVSIYIFFFTILWLVTGRMESFPLKQHARPGWYIEHYIFGCLPDTLSRELGNNAIQTELPTPWKGNKGWRDRGHRDMHIII